MPKNSKSPKDKTKTKPVAAPEPRKLKQPTYRSFKLQKKLPKPEMVKLSSSFKILRQVFGVLGKNWKLFLGIALVYAVLNLLLVQGFFGTDVAGTKDSVNSMASGQLGKLSGGLSVLGTISASAGTDASTSAYRFVLLIIASLATIWGLRQVMAGEKIRVRDTFYEGMYPLVPFVLVFLVASLQLAPMAFALYLYSVSASTGLEIIIWLVLLLALAALTLYMLSSSLFALYIVALPGMRPAKALRSAVSLVRHRRFMVIRRLLFLPLVLVLATSIIMLPVIALAAPAATVVFFVIIMVVVPIIHSYMYMTYRELLHEK